MECNSCNSHGFSIYLSHKGLNLMQCGHCGLVFIDKIPGDDNLKEYYQDKFYDKRKAERFIKPFEVGMRFLRRWRVWSIQGFCSGSGKVVDVGFSRGTTLQMLKDRGWEVLGTQISRNAYDNAKRSGLNVFLGELAGAGLVSKSVDLVTFWHVLEHLRDPAFYLKETARILKDGGKLIVEVPNAAGINARLFKEKWFGLDLPRHLYHFSPRALSILLKKSGFRIAKEEYFSFEQNPFSLLQSILNVFNRRHNILFESIKKNRRTGFFEKLYNWLLAGIFIFPSLLFSWLAGIFKKGDIMRFYCLKESS